MNARKMLAGAFIVMLGMGMTSFKEDDRNFQISKNLDIFNSIFKELDMFYVDTVNAEKMIQTGVEGMLSLTDPYTEYYPEEEVSSLKEMTTGKYGGIGAAIRYYEAKDRIAVVEPTEGMPAAEAGVKAGDIILSVGGKEMVRGDMKPQEFSSKVSEALRGEPGTSFVLKVLRPLKNDSTVMEFKITRKNIRTNPVPYYGMVKDSIGYLALSSFTENSAKDFKKAFIELKQKGAKSLIIDLRDNGGGSLSEAVDIVNLYVPKGQEIVVTKGKVRQAQGSYKTQNEPVDTQIPLAVLRRGHGSGQEVLRAAHRRDEGEEGRHPGRGAHRRGSEGAGDAVQGGVQVQDRRRLPHRPQGAADGRHQGRFPLLGQPPRHLLPPHERYPLRLGHRGQRSEHGIRQHGQRQRYRCCIHPQPLHRRKETLRRVSHERTGRGRCCWCSYTNAHFRDGAEVPGSIRTVQTGLRDS